MNNIFGLLLILLFGGAGLVSIFIIISLLFPAWIEKNRGSLENSMGRALLLGLVNFIFAGILVGLLALVTRLGGVFAAVAVFLIGLIMLVVLILTLLGLVAASSLLGSRLGAVNSPLASHVRGGILLILACLTPYLGWFIFTPLVAWTAFGASIQNIFRRPAAPVPA